jgi:acetyl-CoA C-acetyltransferase
MNDVAIVAVGQTKHRANRKDVNVPEMIREAVEDCFARTSLRPQDVDAVVFGNMHTFEGVNQPELWAGPMLGLTDKPMMRIATGGTTGATAAAAAYYHVASGLARTVLAIGFEKHSEGHAQMGLISIALPEGLFMLRYEPSTGVEQMQAGGSAGGAAFQAQSYMHASGATEEHFAMHVVKNRRNACKNPYAHLQAPTLTIEDVLKTPMISYPIRYGFTCPASDGACVMLYTTGDIARKKDLPAAFVHSTASCSTDPCLNPAGATLSDPAEQLACKLAAKWAYERAGISDPRKEIDYAEIYDPFAHQEMMWSERLGLFDEGKGPEMLEKGVTQIDGDLPINASGGVIATNAIGATAMMRVGEAALQIMGQAGERQVPKKVNKTVSHGWGGLFQFVTVTVLGREPKKS